MKKYFFAVFTLVFLVSIGCANNSDNKSNDPNNLTWVNTIEDGIKIAKSENKGILVNFTGSDWCIWCKRLNGEVFTQKDFADYAKANLVLVKLDFPRSIPQSDAVKKYNSTMAAKYGVRGFPSIILLDKNGNFVYQTGYLEGGAKNYVSHLKQVFSKS